MISETLTIGDALLGIVWAIAAFSFKNIGYVLQKAGVNKSGLDKTKRTTMQDGMKPDSDGDVEELTEEVKEEGQLLKSPIWWIGQTITMLGAFSLIMAYGTNAPLPLVMPFMGVGLIVSVIFCKYYLKEEVTSKEWLSSLVIVVGIVLVTVVYEDLAAEPTELGSYFTAYVQPQSLIFFALAIGGLIIAIVWSVKNDYKYASVIFGIAAGDIGGTSLLFQTPFSKGLSLIFAGGEIVEAGFWWMFIVGVLGFAVGGVLAIVFENMGGSESNYDRGSDHRCGNYNVGHVLFELLEQRQEKAPKTKRTSSACGTNLCIIISYFF